MSVSDRFPLDPEKLQTLTRDEAINLISVLAKNMKHSPSEDCLQRLTSLCLPQPKLPIETSESLGSQSKKKNKKKVFDISNYRQRHIALHLYYDGAKYQGFASSTDCDTVEEHLFAALIKLRLIESRASSGYTRCGRTDKGVSAVGQVISLRLRSNLPKSTEGYEEAGNLVEEMDYCSMLNKSLPEDIRVLGWCEVSDGFSSRFSAVSRTYRYFFLRKRLNLTAMQAAASLLIGDHDFRNVCKMNVASVSNFRRVVYEANIVRHSGGCGAGDNTEDEVWMLEITGMAFLWHMVRCIMAILTLVGEGKEQPEVVTSLLDIETVPAKPEYFMAPELPLVLYRSGFDNLTFTYNSKNLFTLMSHFETLFDRYYLAAVRIRNVMNYLKEVDVKNADVEDFVSYMHKGKTLEAPKSSKRRKVEYEEGSDHGSSKWHSALNSLAWRGIVPSPQISTKKEKNNKYDRSTSYVPLLQRSQAETYDTRVSKLTGAKLRLLEGREEIKKNTASSALSADEDMDTGGGDSSLEFFTRMRKEGTVLDKR